MKYLVNVSEFGDRTKKKITDFQDPIVFFSIQNKNFFCGKNMELLSKFKLQERTVKMQILRNDCMHNAHEPIGMQTKTCSIIYRNISPQLQYYLHLCLIFHNFPPFDCGSTECD